MKPRYKEKWKPKLKPKLRDCKEKYEDWEEKTEIWRGPKEPSKLIPLCLSKPVFDANFPFQRRPSLLTWLIALFLRFRRSNRSLLV